MKMISCLIAACIALAASPRMRPLRQQNPGQSERSGSIRPRESFALYSHDPTRLKPDEVPKGRLPRPQGTRQNYRQGRGYAQKLLAAAGEGHRGEQGRSGWLLQPASRHSRHPRRQDLRSGHLLRVLLGGSVRRRQKGRQHSANQLAAAGVQQGTHGRQGAVAEKSPRTDSGLSGASAARYLLQVRPHPSSTSESPTQCLPCWRGEREGQLAPGDKDLISTM